MRIYELAQELNLKSADLIEYAKAVDFNHLHNNFSVLSDEEAETLKNYVSCQTRYEKNKVEEKEAMTKSSKKTNNSKLYRKLMIGVATTASLATLAVNTGVSLANAESIDKAPKAEEVTKTTQISSKYSFIARWNAQTKVETFGSGWHKTTKNDMTNLNAWTLLNPSDSQKGKVGVIYKNVGKYKGQNVNLKITVLDWDPYFTKNRMISYGIDSISHQQTGYNSVKQKWEYVDDNGKAIDMAGTYMTFTDIDALQSIQFDKTTSNNISKILYDKGSILQYFDHNDQIEIKAKDNVEHDNDDKNTMFTALFNGSSMTFSWKRDYKNAGYSTEHEADKTMGGREHFSYMGKKLAPTEMIAPTKKVSDTDEKNKDSNKLDTVQEGFNYSVYQEIPDEWKEFYYKNLSITDTLLPELELAGKVKVVDEGNKDHTSFFKDNSKGNDLKFDATSEALQKADFYGHTYQLQVPVKVKAGASLDKYKDKEGHIVLPNTAKVKVNNDEKSSNKVTTTVPQLIKQKIDKYIIDDGKAVESDTLTKDDPVGTYRIDNVIPNAKVPSSIVLDDDLDDHLNLVDGEKSVKVVMSDAGENKVTVEKGEESQEKDSTESSTKASASEEKTTSSTKDSSTNTTTSTDSKKESKSSDYDYALKSAQVIVDKYKDAKDGTVDHVILSDAQMTVNAIEGFKKGDKIAVDKNIEIIQNAMNASGESNKPNDTQKADFQKLIDILNGVSERTNVTTSSSSDPKEETKDSSKGQSDKSDEATANEATDSEIKEDASKEMTGDATPKGTDITNKDKLEITDGNHIKWTANNPKELVGKKVSLIVQVKLKDGTKVSDVKDGKIPNTAKMTIDGKDTKSNTVYLGVDKAPELPKKEETKPSSKEEIPGEAKPKDVPKYMPQTGTDAMKEVGIGVAGLGLGGLLGFFFGRKKK